MIIRAQSTRTFDIEECHGGAGAVTCREIMGDYDKASPGFKYVHEDILEPGVSIGEHLHQGDEEIYWVLEGEGTFTLDGETFRVSAGDVCLTRDGQRHSLVNSGSSPMRLLVVAAELGGSEPSTLNPASS